MEERQYQYTLDIALAQRMPEKILHNYSLIVELPGLLSVDLLVLNETGFVG